MLVAYVEPDGEVAMRCKRDFFLNEITKFEIQMDTGYGIP